MDFGIRGKCALIMGSSSGIGYAIAQALHSEGVRVALCARNKVALENASKSLNDSIFVECDLSIPGEGTKAVNTVIKELGKVDILVTNTGGPPSGAFSDISITSWQQWFQNLWLSAVDSIKASLPLMKQNRWGRILLITSVAAKEPIANLTVSNGLRAGLLGLANSLSREVACDGITVNAILPGYTKTERLLELGIPEETFIADIPAKRLGEPKELAALAAFLVSQQAAYITGQAIACDGGCLRSI